MKRSDEYTKLIEQLKDSITSSINIASNLVEQSKKDGLSKEEINKLIIKQMNREDVRETCSLTKFYYYLLNDFLNQTGAADVEYVENRGWLNYSRNVLMLAGK
jgi:hypothetical protein